MKKMLIFLTFLLLLGCSSESTPAPVTIQTAEANPFKQAAQKLEENVRTSNEQETYDAKKIFQSSCSACHESLEVITHALPSGVTEEQIVSIISDGFKEMPSLSNILNEGQIKAVAKEMISINSK